MKSLTDRLRALCLHYGSPGSETGDVLHESLEALEGAEKAMGGLCDCKGCECCEFCAWLIKYTEAK